MYREQSGEYAYWCWGVAVGKKYEALSNTSQQEVCKGPGTASDSSLVLDPW